MKARELAAGAGIVVEKIPVTLIEQFPAQPRAPLRYRCVFFLET